MRDGEGNMSGIDPGYVEFFLACGGIGMVLLGIGVILLAWND